VYGDDWHFDESGTQGANSPVEDSRRTRTASWSDKGSREGGR